MQAQVNEPSVSVHVPLAEHESVPAVHSSMSVHESVASPVQPVLQTQLFEFTSHAEQLIPANAPAGVKKPPLQAQVNEPSVSVHVPSSEHESVPAVHSSMSVHESVASPVQPVLQTQLFEFTSHASHVVPAAVPAGVK